MYTLSNFYVVCAAQKIHSFLEVVSLMCCVYEMHSYINILREAENGPEGIKGNHVSLV